MRYCEAACRAAAFRKRVKERSLASGGTEASAPTVTEANPATDTATANADRTDQAEPSHAAYHPGKKRKRGFHTPPPPQANRPAQDRRPLRVPFDQQVQCQAPPEAVAYRLLLPARPHDEVPKVAPAPDGEGRARAYRLNPFELPDDLRLRDDRVYRILWVGPNGEPVSPKGTSHLPALYFFLGPADSPEGQQQDKYSSVLRDVSDPELRKKCEYELASLRLTELHQEQEVATHERRLTLLATERRLEEETDAARQKKFREASEEAERIAARHRAQQEKQQEARQKDEIRGLLGALGITLGIPVAGTAIDVLFQKLEGKPVDWSELKDRLSEAAQVGMAFLAKAQDRVKSARELAETSINPRPASTAELQSLTEKDGRQGTAEGQGMSPSSQAGAGSSLPQSEQMDPGSSSEMPSPDMGPTKEGLPSELPTDPQSEKTSSRRGKRKKLSERSDSFLQGVDDAQASDQTSMLSEVDPAFPLPESEPPAGEGGKRKRKRKRKTRKT